MEGGGHALFDAMGRCVCFLWRSTGPAPAHIDHIPFGVVVSVLEWVARFRFAGRKVYLLHLWAADAGVQSANER